MVDSAIKIMKHLQAYLHINECIGSIIFFFSSYMVRFTLSLVDSAFEIIKHLQAFFNIGSWVFLKIIIHSLHCRVDSIINVDCIFGLIFWNNETFTSISSAIYFLTWTGLSQQPWFCCNTINYVRTFDNIKGFWVFIKMVPYKQGAHRI